MPNVFSKSSHFFSTQYVLKQISKCCQPCIVFLINAIFINRGRRFYDIEFFSYTLIILYFCPQICDKGLLQKFRYKMLVVPNELKLILIAHVLIYSLSCPQVSHIINIYINENETPIMLKKLKLYFNFLNNMAQFAIFFRWYLFSHKRRYTANTLYVIINKVVLTCLDC